MLADPGIGAGPRFELRTAGVDFLMNTRQSTVDKVKGAARKLKGKAKEAAGNVTGDRNLQDEGKADQIAGGVQKKFGQVERVFEP